LRTFLREKYLLSLENPSRRRRLEGRRLRAENSSTIFDLMARIFQKELRLELHLLLMISH